MLNLKIQKQYTQLGPEFGTFVEPSPLSNPKLICLNTPLARTLGLKQPEKKRSEIENIFAGAKPLEGSAPYAMVYSGHQFGGYSPQLGDGRGLLLGEATTDKGVFDIHLKGAGITPYSRFGDGKAVLRSCLREYLGSLAMEGLGIPTTQALCVVKGEKMVEREELEPEAMLTRIAKTHIRFGSFEYFHYTQQVNATKVLADYAIKQCIPSEQKKEGCYEKLFQHIVISTAHLIAQWQSIGFCHGVMNTDNMSIAGETMDYGPFGFMEKFNANHICNHSGRYAFDQQPSIGLWNLNALATALSSLIQKNELQSILKQYEPSLIKKYMEEMRNKLGLTESQNLAQEKEQKLLNSLFSLLQKYTVDYTFFFRALSYHTHPNWLENILELVFQANSQKLPDNDFKSWLLNYRAIIDRSPNSKIIETSMLRKNPKYILRNYLAQNIIEEAYQGESTEQLNKLVYALSSPYKEHPHLNHLASQPPSWAEHLSVSCSS